MEVKAGYKQTDVGIIPNDWDVTLLGQHLRRTPTYGINAPAISFNLRYPTYLRITDITDEGRFDETSKASVSHSASASYLLESGDLVFARTGASVGKSYLYNPNDGQLVFAGFLIRVSPDAKRLAPEYLKYFVQSQVYWDWVRSNSMRSGQPGINGREYASLPIPLPPIDEQETIAKALSDADALIEALEQLLDKKRQIKQGAIQELITGKRRLFGFNKKWGVKRLGDVASFYSGGTPFTENASYFGGEIPWITSSDLNKDVIDDVDGRITELGLMNSSAKMVNANTLLIAMYGITAGVTAITKIRAAINQAVLAIIPHKDNYVFLYYKLRYLKDWIIATYTQGGQPNLSGVIVKSIEITMPEVEEQTAIAEILSDMDAEITALEAKLSKAREVKAGMMSELLTGRIRLI